MSARTCIVCGRSADDDHHLTGSVLDPMLLLPHCHDHHELMHDDWWTAGVGAKRRRGVEMEPAPATFLDGLYLRLRRLALWLGRLAEASRPISGPLAAAVAGWSTDLLRCLNALDAGWASWRDLPGMAE
jgi:hypothetical protein